MSDRLLDIFRVRQYFNAITAARQLVEMARQDARFLDTARRALLPLPFETWPVHHGPVFPARSRERLGRLHGRRVAVIASGGSGATAAVIGVMQALEEVGVKPALMSLCSRSAFFGLPVAAGQTSEDVARFMAGLQPTDYLDPNWRDIARIALRSGQGFAGLVKGERVEATRAGPGHGRELRHRHRR